MATATKTVHKPAMPKPAGQKPDDKAQYERFRKFAREHETDDDPDTFDRKFGRIVPPRSSQS